MTAVCILSTNVSSNPKHDEPEPWETSLRALGFEDTASHAGGTKHPQTSVWLAGFNGLDKKEMAEKLKAILRPVDPKAIVMIHRENDEWWSIWSEANVLNYADVT